MKGFYDRGHYDLDTYEEGVPVPRSASDFKIGMDVVEQELDYLATDPTGGTVALEIIELASEGVERDGILSQAIKEPDGAVKTWGMRYGRQLAMDVVNHAQSIRRDVRFIARAPRAKDWTRLKRTLAPGWRTFRSTTHTD